MSIGFLLRTFCYSSLIYLEPLYATHAYSFHIWFFLLHFLYFLLYLLKISNNVKSTLSFLKEKLNSMNLLLYMAPMAVFFLLPATIFMEENVLGVTLALAKEDKKIIWYLLFNSSLAYFVNLTNFLVTKHTSALTLQVHYFSYYFSLSPKITKHITSINFRFLVMPKVPWRLSFRY